MAKDYRLILKTQLDVTAIQKQIDDLQKKIAKTNFSVGSRGGSKGALKIVDAQAELRSLDQIYARIKELGGKNVQTTSITGKLGNTTGEIIKYRNAQNDVITETYKLERATKTSAEGFSLVTKEVKGSVKSVGTWTDGLSNAIQRTLQYATSTALLYGALNQLRQGFKYIIDLNKEMVNIQLVTGGSKEEINSLARSYNELGKEMSVSTLEIAKGSLEFIRQGKTAEETGILIKNSTMLSKLGNLEAAAASEYLTSIMNGFKLSAEETTSVVDRLVAIDNIAATSVREIANAMQYASATSQIVGIDFDHLAAYIGTISAVTRRSSEEIGQSLKTIELRMVAIKNMKAFDDEGEAINKVEGALMGVNVKLRDSNGHFRDMQDVLDELASKWTTFSREEQIFIAQQIGGVRQADKLLALLGNELEIKKQLAAEAKSSGLADERYAIFQKGIEAAQGRMTVAWEKLAMSTATSDMISGFYNSVTALLELVDALGGFKTILSVAIPIIILFNAELIKTSILTGGSLVKGILGLIPALFGATGATNGLTVALGAANIAALPFIASLALIGGLTYIAITAGKEYNKTLQDTKANLIDVKKELIDSAGSYEDYVKKMKAAASGTGVQYEKDTGKAFRGAGRGVKVYIEELDLLTEAQWNAKESADSMNSSVNSSTGGGHRFGISPDTIADDELLTRIDTAKTKLSELDAILLKIGQGDISAELTNQLDTLGVTYDIVDGKLVVAQSSLDSFYDSIREGVYETNTLTESQKQLADSQLESLNMLIYGFEMSRGSFVNMANDLSGTIFSAAENAKFALYDINGTLLTTSDQVQSAFLSNYANFTKIINEMTNAGIISASQFLSFLNQTANFSKGLIPYKPDASQIVTPVGGGGGGGGGGKSNEQIRLEKEIKKLEDKKKKLKDLIDEFKKYIDAQKESLRLQKEEDDFSDSLLKKNQSLAKLKSQIAILALDNSEEARAKRLELEEEASNLETEIAQDKEDREYQLKIDALEKAQQAYEDNINAQIEGIDSTIEKYKEQSSAIQSSGGSVGGVSQATKDLGAVTATVGQQIVDWYSKQAQLSESNRAELQKAVDLWREQGLAVDEISLKAMQLTEVLKNFVPYADILNNLKLPELDMRSRGYTEQHHEGGFAGGLKSNEVYAKLMKGEYVSTEKDMNNFLKKTLPSMLGVPSFTTNGGNGNISISMPINVAGNLDKSIIPDLKKITNNVIKEINKNMEGRGYNRRADAFSI